jgi:hypothetical protein
LVVRVGILETMRFEEGLEGEERLNYREICRKSILERGKSLSKGPKVCGSIPGLT